MEFDHRPGGCIAETLPVDWNGIPGVLDQHFNPMYGGRRKVGSDQEGQRKDPVVQHEDRKLAPIGHECAALCAVQMVRGLPEQRSVAENRADLLAEMQGLYVAFHRGLPLLPSARF